MLPVRVTLGGVVAMEGLMSHPFVTCLEPKYTDMFTEGTNMSTTSPMTRPTTSGSTDVDMIRRKAMNKKAELQGGKEGISAESHYQSW